VQEPQAIDLQPVQNNTNPLFVQLGNPDLKPTLQQSFLLSIFKYDMERQLDRSFTINPSFYHNFIIQERSLSPEGIQTTRPVNVAGVWRINARGSISKEYKFNGKNLFFVGSNLSVAYNNSLVLLNAVKSEAKFWTINPALEGRINLADKYLFEQTFTLGQQRSLYSNNAFDNRFLMNRYWRGSVNIRHFEKLVWFANLDYWYNSNAAPGIQDNITRLNVGVTYQFLKENRGELKLSVFDLLNQNVNVSRIIRENLIEDVQTTVLTRYALLTFNYNIRNFGGKGGNK